MHTYCSKGNDKFITFASHIMNTKAKGYILGIIAAATYGLNPLFAINLYREGMNPESVLFFRYLIAIILLLIMIKLRGRNLKVEKKNFPLLVFMGIIMAVSSLSLFASYNYMSVSIASTLLFVYPIIVALIMTIFFKEKLSMQTILCILLACGGIWLLYKTSTGATLNLKGVILVLVSALSYGIYLVGVNQTRLKNVATLQITIYVLIFGLSLFAFRLLTGVPLTLPDKWYLWTNILALAIFPTIISFLCTTSAIKYIGSTPTAILGALEPLTAVLVGIIAFGEKLTPRECLGLILILVAVTLVIAGGRISTQLLRFRKLFPKLPLTKRNQ